MDVQMIDHKKVHGICERTLGMEATLTKTGSAEVARAYLALTAEVEALRKVKDAALAYKEFLPDIGYSIATRNNSQVQSAMKLREVLAALPEGEL